MHVTSHRLDNLALVQNIVDPNLKTLFRSNFPLPIDDFPLQSCLSVFLSLGDDVRVMRGLGLVSLIYIDLVPSTPPVLANIQIA